MLSGFKASNGRNRTVDIRSQVQRLDVQLIAETPGDAEMLARLRATLAESIRDGRPIADIQITLAPDAPEAQL